MAYFHCLLRYLAPSPSTNDDIEQSPAQGTVEGDLEQLLVKAFCDVRVKPR